MKKKNLTTALIISMIFGVSITGLAGCGSSDADKVSDKKENTRQVQTDQDDEAGADPDSKDTSKKEKSKKTKKDSEGINEKLNAAKNVTNNGGTVIKWGGNTYYWRYNKDSFESSAIFQNYSPKETAENELVCVDANGDETVIYTGNGHGDLYIVGNRMYFQINAFNESGYAYANDLVYMEWQNGGWNPQDVHNIGKKTIVAADPERNAIIYSGETDNGKKGLYVMDHESEKETIIGEDVSFVLYDNAKGEIFYQDHSMIEDEDQARKGALALCKSDLNGNSELLTKTKPELYNFASGGRCMIDCAQVTEEKIYFSYGRYDGTANIFQGGKIVSVGRDGSDFWTIVEIDENSDFCVFKENEDDILLYEKKFGEAYRKNVHNQLTSKTEDPVGPLGEVFSEYDRDTKETTYYLYPDSDSEVLKLFTDGDYVSDDSEKTINIRDIEYVDGDVYYRIDYGIHDASGDIGWRYQYNREKTEAYRKNLATGKTELIYGY